MIYLLEPVGIEFLKGIFPGGVIDNNYALCSLVVGAGDSPEPFLAGRVPNLELDDIALDDYGSTWSACLLEPKVDSDGG